MNNDTKITEIPTEVPKPPRGIGFSKRFLITMFGVLLIVVVVFLLMINHYAAKRYVQEAARPIANSKGPMNSQDVSSLIAHINSQKHKPLITKPEKHNGASFGVDEDKTVNTSRDQDQLSIGMDQKAFTDGGNSGLSVFKSNVSLAATTASTMPNVAGDNNSLGLASKAAAASKDGYVSQNMQNEKTAFLKSDSNSKDTLSSRLKHPVSPFEVQAGNIIPATMMTAVNSDLPGTMIATVRENVFDSATGNYLLIPQGTKLIGTYDSQVAYGQTRVLIVWSRLIFPDGSSFDLEGMPGADLTGMAGLHDKVDNHYFKIFGSALMFSVFGAAGQLSQPQNNSNQLTAQQIVAGAIGQQLSQTAMQLVARNMDIQPTIKIRPGDMFNVLLTRDMVLPRPYKLS